MNPLPRQLVVVAQLLALTGCIVVTSSPGTDGGTSPTNAQACKVNGDCLSDELCVGKEGVGYYCRQACDTGVCPSSTSCELLSSGKSACLPVVGKGTSCDLGVCQSGLKCVGKDTGGSICMTNCTSNAASCTSSESCELLTSGSLACFPTVGAGKACNTGTAVCQAGLSCTNGVCTASGGTGGTKGQSCSSSAPCAQGLRCAGSQSAGYFCRTDCTSSSFACTSSEECTALAGSGSACIPAVGSGQSCNGATVVCESGLTCTSGTCSGGSSGTGEVVFWENSSTGCADNTSVTFGGQTDSISTYTSSGPPSCGASGPANFTLTAGSYTFSASCASSAASGSSNTQTGVVTVQANQCVAHQLTWN